MPEQLVLCDKPVARLLLSHGAGAPVQSEFCQLLAQQLANQGIEVWGFNFAYMQKTLAGKRQLPAKMPVLMAEFLEQLSQMPTDLPLVIAGKSMGGRVATLLAASELLPGAVKAVIAFGYPFHPPKKDNWRTEHFADLKRPVLVLQGERDPFGSIQELAGKSWPLIEIKWLQSGDHDFSPLKKSGFSQQQLIEQASLLSRSFINEFILEN
ncbi:MAG: alpha/beta fold hydrolase [Gammaproteobacteria bacterium]|nr:alpha/beta fold hydrolase [Gammaproteobacteria bacterium]MBU2058071.1 alpha/beta fold hydrolase [Gammaproteobacteria bacterium]MBU2175978.1 alpha/beta fold hydrolase [Gammaproteobacteria bacterium]MBU2247165.1 alpha/beta fold hydrolase [Gammaproteobacteria bacterium]MBU2343317.1 alpha/beta fold hydrolase [Gammaproteobacteria bacterium]